MASIFRRESDEARASSWLGRVILIRPLSFTFMTLMALGFTIALAAFFVFGEYTRKARLTGVLAPAQGVMKILAQQNAVVEAVHVREGETVAAEAVLVVLGDSRMGRQHEGIAEEVVARLEKRQRALAEQRAHALAAAASEQLGLESRADGLRREIEHIEAEIESQSRRSTIAELAVDRARRLESIGFLSPAAREREQESALDQQARLESARRTRMSLVRELASLEFEMRSARSRAQSQVAALDIQKASIEQERIERDVQFHTVIAAPAAGLVATVLVEPGQMVTQGMPLATLIPVGTPLEAHLFSASRSIGFVRTGQDVLLRYLAYPHQKFGLHKASVVAIARNPMLAGELGFTPLDGTREPLYRIKAALDSQAIRAYGKLEPLQAGMQVEADVLLDRRRLIEWIFEPLLSLAGRA